ncbi:MAG: penicillin-binding transpeptidase domain-containing protein [Patescibacteria group bacterium]
MGVFGRRQTKQVELDEVLLDASNLPEFSQGRMEGKMELPIANRNVFLVGGIFMLVALLFMSRIYSLQVTHGAEHRATSDNNSVAQNVIIAERGVVYDRNDEMLAWNEFDYSGEYDFPIRAYTDRSGLGQLLGYVSYPQKDNRGFYFRTDYIGRTGVEQSFGEILEGANGRQIIETDALGELIAEHAIAPSTPGKPIKLSIDAELSEAMYDIISTSSAQAGFRSGAGAIMDIHTGEIIALTSYPSYDPEVMADGDDVELIEQYNNDDRFPFLNKIVGGAYTPGSVVKPFVAYAALEEGTISPDKTIVSNGEIVIPNPYNPENPSIFRDWRSHGKMTMREAIAYSSNVYFYIIGGGFGDQGGLGITKMHEYFTRFGLGSRTGVNLGSEQAGVVPNPAWKEETFDDDWRLGDTYFTAIGQYGFLSTPIQMLRAYAALANGGMLVSPHVVYGEQGATEDINLDPASLQIVHEGMRKTVNFPGGTARGLERNDVAVAAKSGTAELGAGNAFVNSWAAGFWPYEEPQYAFVLMMDRAPRDNTLGATTIMGKVVGWMADNRPAYLGIESEGL